MQPRPPSQQQPPAVVARRIVQYVEEVQVVAAAVGVPLNSPSLGGGRSAGISEHGGLEPQLDDLEAPPEEEDEVQGVDQALGMPNRRSQPLHASLMTHVHGLSP